MLHHLSGLLAPSVSMSRVRMQNVPHVGGHCFETGRRLLMPELSRFVTGACQQAELTDAQAAHLHKHSMLGIARALGLVKQACMRCEVPDAPTTRLQRRVTGVG